MKIHHVGYLTKNIELSIKEFKRLGFTIEQNTVSDPYRSINICFLINDNYRVELIEPQGVDSPIYGLLKKYKNTPYHFCYIVSDLKGAIEELIEGGYTMIQEPLVAPAIQGARVAFLMNIDVGIIELLEQ